MKKREKDLMRAGDDGVPASVLEAADQSVQTAKKAKVVADEKIDEKDVQAMEGKE